MSDILTPCPFCGGQPMGPIKDGGSDERYGYNFVMRISCDCGARISRPSHQGTGGWCDDTGQAKNCVIEAWNRRAAIAEKREPADCELCDGCGDDTGLGTQCPECNGTGLQLPEPPEEK